jgi:hypothetical protein
VTPDGPVLMELKAPSTVADGEGTATRTSFRPTNLMEKISRALEAAPEPLSQNSALDPAVVRGNERAKAGALKILVAENYVIRSPGARNSFLHTSVRPYRETADPLSDSYVPELETVTRTPTTATVSVSVERETERRSLDRLLEAVGSRSETVGDGDEAEPREPYQPVLVAADELS